MFVNSDLLANLEQESPMCFDPSDRPLLLGLTFPRELQMPAVSSTPALSFSSHHLLGYPFFRFFLPCFLIGVSLEAMCACLSFDQCW